MDDLTDWTPEKDAERARDEMFADVEDVLDREIWGSDVDCDEHEIDDDIEDEDYLV